MPERPRGRRVPTTAFLHAVLLSLLLLLAARGVAHAQFTRFAPYADAQGLGNLSVTAITQDADGYLLFGTEGGLYLFDGLRFREDLAGLPHEWIVELETDGAGRVWAVTTEGHVFVGVHQRFTLAATMRPGLHLAFSQHSIAVSGDELVVNDDGTLRHAAIGPAGVGPLTDLLDARTRAAVRALGRPGFVVRDGPAGLFFGCGTALCRLDGARLRVYGPADGLPADAWQVAARGPGGTLWVRSLGRLAFLRPGAPHFASVPVPGQHTAFFADHRGTLALLPFGRGGVLTQADEGLLRWDGAAWHMLAPHTGGLPATSVMAMFADREGSLWVGSEGSGALRAIGLGVWEHFSREDGLPSDLVWSIRRVPSGPLWVATDNGTVPIGGGGGAPVPGLDYALAVTRAGQLWIAPHEGPLLRTGPGGETARVPLGEVVFQSFVDDADRLWLAGRHGVFETGADAPADSLRIRRVLDEPDCRVAAGAGGATWAICRGGIFRLGADGASVRVAPPGLFEGQPADAAFVSPDELWVGTDVNGVTRLRVTPAGGIAAIGKLDRAVLGSDNILFIRRDSRGWIWIGTDGGLVLHDARSWRRLDSSVGPVSNDTDEWSVLEDTDGSMWFGTSHGLSHLIDPARLPAEPPLHPAITGVTLDGHPLAPTTALRAKWSGNPLAIRFVDLDYARGGGVVFRYRLRGIDTGWTETDEHEVRYVAVPAGRYRFELVAVDTIHGGVSAPVGFTLRIEAPWWRRPWFFAAAGLAIVLALAEAWQMRVRFLLRQRRRLECEVAQRTAEIERARAQLERQAVELRHIAMHDALTGLLNRNAVMGRLEALVAAAREPGGGPLSVLLCDIDHFKSINDGFGHLAGDAVLAELGARLRMAVAGAELAGRYGGEEFLLLLPLGPAEARNRVARIVAGVTGAPFPDGAAGCAVTLSGGLATLRPADTPTSLLARADAALYEAKNRGRDRIEEEEAPGPRAVAPPLVSAS